MAFWWASLFKVFWLQAVVARIVSAPVGVALLAEAPAALGGLDGLGIALVAVGLLFEAGGDWAQPPAHEAGLSRLRRPDEPVPPVAAARVSVSSAPNPGIRL